MLNKEDSKGKMGSLFVQGFFLDDSEDTKSWKELEGSQYLYEKKCG